MAVFCSTPLILWLLNSLILSFWPFMSIGIYCWILKKEASWTKLRAALIYGNKHKHSKSNLTTGPFSKIAAGPPCYWLLTRVLQCHVWIPFYRWVLGSSLQLVGYSHNIHVSVAANITSYLNTLMISPPPPTAACMASPGTMKTSHQGTSLQLRSSLIFPRPTIKMCCVFSSRVWSFSSGEQPRALANWVGALEPTWPTTHDEMHMADVESFHLISLGF